MIPLNNHEMAINTIEAEALSIIISITGARYTKEVPKSKFNKSINQ